MLVTTSHLPGALSKDVRWTSASTSCISTVGGPRWEYSWGSPADPAFAFMGPTGQDLSRLDEPTVFDMARCDVLLAMRFSPTIRLRPAHDLLSPADAVYVTREMPGPLPLRGGNTILLPEYLVCSAALTAALTYSGDVVVQLSHFRHMDGRIFLVSAIGNLRIAVPAQTRCRPGARCGHDQDAISIRHQFDASAS